MADLDQAVLPYAPFGQPTVMPTTHPGDGLQICVSFNQEWAGYVIGALFSLLADSTWDSHDTTAVHAAERDAWSIIQAISAFEACPMPVEFRLNPTDGHYWDFSNDGGATWTRQPNTVPNFVPTFVVDGASPSGYDETVNGGITSTPIPKLTATDPNAVIVNPTSSGRNEIQTDGFVNAEEIGILGSVSMILAGNGAMLYAKWDPDLSGIDALFKLKRTTDYSQPIIVTED